MNTVWQQALEIANAIQRDKNELTAREWVVLAEALAELVLQTDESAEARK